MTAALARPRTWLVALLAVVALFAVLQVVATPLPRIQAPLSEHALEKHGHDAEIAGQCLNGQEGWLFVNPQLGRIAIVCWLGDRFGIVILTAAFAVITAFVCSKLKTRKRMVDYMHRQGYR